MRAPAARRRWLASLAAVAAAVGLTVLGPPPADAAGELVATFVETSDIHADRYPASNAALMNATASVAAAQNPDAVLLAGDVTEDGDNAQLQALDESGWGVLKPKTLSAPGNHEYHATGAQPWKDYFGYTQSYNARVVNGVLLLALDIASSASASAGVGSPQYQWVQSQLTSNAGKPVIAFWHIPRYSTAEHGDSSYPSAMWDLLQSYGAELVFSGDDHSYQRFPKANSNGTLNAISGLREIIGATGGSPSLYSWTGGNALTPEYRQNSTQGVTRVKVYTDHLEWAFLGVDGTTMDSGSQDLYHPIGEPPPPPANTAPSVNAGPDRSVTLPSSLTIDATVTDDGRPDPPGTVTTQWTKVSGPGTVAFENASSVDTTVTFATEATYVLRLTADDGALSASDDVTVTVRAQPPPGGTTVERTITVGSDDAEEYTANYSVGTVDLSSSDLDLGYDTPNVPQTVGLRFPTLAVPSGAAVGDARLQFQADEATTEVAAETIKAQAADNAATFVASTKNITSRPTTSSSVTWDVPAWPTIGARGPEQRSADLSPVLQEVVDRPGWSSGNALVLVVAGTGRRTAESVEGSGGPTLTVTFTTGAPPQPTNHPPTVSAGPDRSVTLPAAANLDGTVTDDGIPTGSTLAQEWTQVSGPGTTTFDDRYAVDTTATFTEPGSYVLRLTATDGELSAADDVAVTVVTAPFNQAPVVEAGPDQTITLPAGASLDGTVTDDGLPAGSMLTQQWTPISGPGTVTFAHPAAVDTTATFSEPGSYQLLLSANDGELAASDTLTVTVNAAPPPTNRAPTVSAGPDLTIYLNQAATLNGTVTDDGLPPGSTLRTTWSKVSGPGGATFADASAVDTTASFSASGTYVLRLTASDGALSASDDATVVVKKKAPPGRG